MDSEEHIFRLNKRIKELIALYEKTLTSNIEIEKVNEQLNTELKIYKKDYEIAASLSKQYKFDAERLQADRDNIFDVHHKQKIKLNEVMKMCREQNDEITRLKKNVHGPVPIAVNRSAPPPPFGLTTPDQKYIERIKVLELDVNKLQAELQESYELIDELEFDVEQIDYLEAENERLQEELLKVNVTDDESQMQSSSHNRIEHDALHLVSHDDDVAVNRSADHTAADDESQPQGVCHQTTYGVVKRVCSSEDAEEADRAARRDLLHKKLESLHEKHRSSEVFDKIFARRSTFRRE